MRWIRDAKHGVRPFYHQAELDRLCEAEVTGFLTKKYGSAAFPLSTDDLVVLIEAQVADLDLYADLSIEGFDVEGVTLFSPAAAPVVKISSSLSTEPRRENRLRTTLAHELGHVKLHAFVTGAEGQMEISHQESAAQRCRRAGIITATKADWMEWQAGYASGALLMPLTALLRVADDVLSRLAPGEIPTLSSEAAQNAILAVSEAFRVSHDAARVRLLQQDLITEGPPKAMLFGR